MNDNSFYEPCREINKNLIINEEKNCEDKNSEKKQMYKENLENLNSSKNII